MAQNYIINAGTLVEDFETFGDWTGAGTAGGSEVANTTPGQFFTGTQSMRLITAGGASSNRSITKTINRSFQNEGVMRIDLYVPDETKVNGITVYLSEDSSFTNYYAFSITSATMRQGHNRFQLNRDGWVRNGTADLGWAVPMIRMRFRVDGASNQVGDISFDNFTCGIYTRPKFVFRFDDGWDDSIVDAKPILDLYNFKASAMIISDNIGTSNYMTLAQLRTLLAAGWDICNHTKTHTNLSTLSLADQTTEYRTCRDFIRDNGLDRKESARELVFPQGGYNSDTISMIASESVKNGHTILSPRCNFTPLDNQLVTIDNIAQTVTLASAKARVDRAIAQGGCAMFLFHLLPASAVAGTEWAIADFADLCKYLYLKSPQIDVVTWTQYLAGMNQE